ncbi:6-pyruvoyl trahydropterin synthase family protein [Ramlibacter montanisoli]|uniref:6-carboxy-5,6,7,8-tetrahydropterin synthase n=1 Tax=Ramlibacter montanisoli TaxID=2732512 RepID=A0A849K8V9_9BURK|nr:6-carboxytetrahydropterin synthase [Ramlibacter montanisoli]NNU44768.1 6-pyruvoyl tetrahydropterin synthase [Ramlibacter montanisoli]
MCAAQLSVATSGFEAARQVAILPERHRSRRLHGHSFAATVFAEMANGAVSFPGAEVGTLSERLEACIAPLNYAFLNDHLEMPTDENLARWIWQRLGVRGIARVALQSTSGSGVDLDRGRAAHVWRRYRFQAAHRLPNVAADHKCGRMHGHGFEVVIHANQDLGARHMSIDYDHLDELWAPLHFELNYHSLNEIEGLQNPTSEVIAAWIWRKLKVGLPELSWVTVYETASCGANFDGREYRIWKEFSFDSATALRHAPQGNARGGLHGHTYQLRLHMKAPLDEAMGWTIDFGDVKKNFDPIFKALDHQPLTEMDGLRDGDTGSLAAWIFAQARPKIPELSRVDLYETPGCGTLLAESLAGPCMPV